MDGAGGLAIEGAVPGLHRVERCLATTLQSIGDAVIATDTAGCVTLMNAVAEALTGWSQSEVAGQPIADIFTIIDTDTRRPLPISIERALGDGPLAGAARRALLVARNGATIPIDASVAPIRDDSDGATGAVLVFRDITAREEAASRLRHYALHDQLTGVANRASLADRIELELARTQRREAHGFAVLFLDIDRFKVINDSLGHAAGDELLLGAARRLETFLRSTDVLARLGGDEFAILLDGVADAQVALRVTERLHAALREPFIIGEGEVCSSASIGIIIAHDGYADAGEVLRDADIAMYRAKAQGKGRSAVFDTAMHAEALAHWQLETDLRRAVERGELRVFYQPIVSLADNQVSGFEALVRWQHPERGLLAPGVFLDVAEEAGLLAGIGWWVLREACRQLRVWQVAFPKPFPLTMSVNLCQQQFNQPDVAALVAAALRETGVDGRSLRLEITEGMLMRPDAAVIERCAQLRALGVQLYVDDFGTGYSSLSVLHHVPIGALKIDRSFVQRMSAEPARHDLVPTIVALAHNLGLDVIAEGVELESHAARLLALDCAFAQGYLFSRPVDGAAAEALLR